MLKFSLSRNCHVVTIVLILLMGGNTKYVERENVRSHVNVVMSMKSVTEQCGEIIFSYQDSNVPSFPRQP